MKIFVKIIILLFERIISYRITPIIIIPSIIKIAPIINIEPIMDKNENAKNSTNKIIKHYQKITKKDIDIFIENLQKKEEEKWDHGEVEWEF